jgi:predicted DNA-binding antitoxin AbrB/MazE fold protein
MRTKAVYEDGVLKPFEKVHLKEGEVVEIEIPPTSFFQSSKRQKNVVESFKIDNRSYKGFREINNLFRDFSY